MHQLTATINFPNGSFDNRNLSFYQILGVNRQYSYGDVTDFNPLSGKYDQESTTHNHPYASTGMVHYPPSSAKLLPREDGDGESTLPV